MTAEVEFFAAPAGWQEDDRGWVYFPFQQQTLGLEIAEMLASCHVIAIASGAVRGQHLHPHHTEWLYLIAGTGTLFWRDREDYLQHQHLTPTCRLVVIAPGVPHALRNDGSEMLYLLAWRATRAAGTPVPETVAAPLI